MLLHGVLKLRPLNDVMNLGRIIERQIREIDSFIGEFWSETNTAHRPRLQISGAHGGRARGLDVKQLLIPRCKRAIIKCAPATNEKLPVISVAEVHVTNVGINPLFPGLEKFKIVDDANVRRIKALSRAGLKKRFRKRRGSVLVRRSALGETGSGAAQAKQSRVHRIT